MKIGVAIPAYNEIAAIQRCLESFAAQTQPVNVYIALDCPTDGTAELLALYPELYTRITTMPQRSGWPKTLNAAAKLAIGDGCDVILTMDADNYVTPDAIEKMARALDGHDWVVTHAQAHEHGPETIATPSAPFPLTLDDFDDAHPPIAAGFTMIRSCIWAEVDGFATDVTLPDSWGYAEDWDFWIRVLKAGYTRGALVPEPLLRVVLSDKQLHLDGMHRHAEARALTMAKHPDVFHPETWRPCGCGCMKG